MMKKALSVALCLLMAGTVLTACSNPDEFSDSENLSLKYTRSDKTDDTFNYADGAKTAPSSYDTYSAKITDFELRLFRNRHKSGSYVFCPANAVLNLEAMANGASGDTQEERTNVRHILQAVFNRLHLRTNRPKARKARKKIPKRTATKAL